MDKDLEESIKQKIVPAQLAGNILRMLTPILLLIAAGAFVLYQSESSRMQAKHTEETNAAVAIGAASISRALHGVTRDLRYLADDVLLRQLLAEPGRSRLDQLAGEWIAFSHNRQVYDQIRWIDETGMERLRVDYRKPNAVRIPDNELQDKGKRYFFTDTFKLKAEEIFVSPLDLNIEGSEIEVPHKPMIRLGMPLFDNGGRKRGILIINYLAVELLDQIRFAPDREQNTGWLLNREGYWLKGSSHNEEFGFMFGNRQMRMAARYPQAWDTIMRGDQGTFDTAEGIWTFRTIYPLQEGQKSSRGSPAAYAESGGITGDRDYLWKVVYLYPSAISDAWKNGFLLKLVLGGIILLVPFGWGVWRLARSQANEQAVRANLERLIDERTYHLTLATKSLEESNDQLEREVAERTRELRQANDELRLISRRDALTGLGNRMAADERLRDEFSRFRRTAQAYSVITVDIDHFKQINDTHGHAAGDDVLRHVADMLKTSIRESDFVARIGGEEFLLLLPSTGPEAAGQVAEKIRRAVALSKAPVAGTVSISLGLAAASSEHGDSHAVLRESDFWLYEAKKAGRNRVVGEGILLQG